VVDENVTHDVRRHREEVRAVLQRQRVLAGQLQERFVHQRRRLQGVAATFASELPPRHVAQVVVDQRHQLGQRRPMVIPLAPDSPQEVGDPSGIGGRGSVSHGSARVAGASERSIAKSPWTARRRTPGQSY
jgi:hypothetical protein